MNIAILGSNGQLGLALTRIVKDRNHSVFPFAREQLDITDQSKCREVLTEVHPDVIINCAAYHVVPECEKNPDLALKINAMAQKYLTDLSHKLSSEMVYISTDKVFDGDIDRPYREDDRTNPIQMYGISKLAGELVTRNYNPKSYIIRTNGVFGGKKGSRAKNGNFVLYILRESKLKDKLEIARDQVANFAYADDLAAGILDLLEKKSPYGIYHLVNEGYASWADFASEIVRVSGRKLQIIPIDRSGTFSGVATPGFCVLDISKAKNIGLSIPSWQQGLKRYISFLGPSA